MIVISLDETGHFENCSDRDEVVLIGGLVFKCEDEDARKKELGRIQDFLSGACKAEKCRYPRDLHYFPEDRNGDTTGKVTNRIKGELSDFLLGTDGWKDTPPYGSYYLYALLLDREQKNRKNFSFRSNLIDDNNASNRYEHMAYRIVENLLFYNPSIKDKNVKLELATRSFPIKKAGADYIDLGYAKRSEYYEITNAAGYKAAISSVIMEREADDTQYSLKVQSINYKKDDSNKDDSNYNQGFLYMADIICGEFRDFIRKKSKTGANELDLVLSGGNELLRQMKTFAYSYGEIDWVFRRAYRNAEEGNYFQALLSMKQAELNKVRNESFYRQNWFPAIEQMIDNSTSTMSLQIALEQLDHYLDQSNCNLSAAEYIHRHLFNQAQHLPIASQPDNVLMNRLLFFLYRTKTRICNHNGDFEQAQAAYNLCISKAQYVSVEDYLEMSNLYCVALVDRMDYQKALEYVNNTVSYEEMLNEVKMAIYDKNNTIFVHYGRSCSQQGQCLAFLRRYEESSEAFERALKSFGDNRRERLFTLSLYLHMLIEKGDLKTYEKYAAEYFGSDDIREQFRLIDRQTDKNRKFMLYVYMKALYCFYRSRTETNVINAIIAKTKKAADRDCDAHPWEMILKYCAFLVLHLNNYKATKASKQLMRQSDKAIAHVTNGILPKIQKENWRQYRELCQGKPLDAVFQDSEMTYMHR